MRSKRFTKRIDIYEMTTVSNGFGGYDVTPTLLGSSWAEVKTYQPGKYSNLSEFGLVDGQNAVQFTVRKRNDLDYNLETMYVLYSGC